MGCLSKRPPFPTFEPPCLANDTTTPLRLMASPSGTVPSLVTSPAKPLLGRARTAGRTPPVLRPTFRVYQLANNSGAAMQFGRSRGNSFPIYDGRCLWRSTPLLNSGAYNQHIGLQTGFGSRVAQKSA